MFDWQQLLDSETGQKLTLLGTALGFVGGAAWIAFKGMVKGRPTSTAVAAAIANAPPVCGARDLGPVFERVRADVAEVRDDVQEVRKDIEHIRDLMIRIEDRTRGGMPR